MSSSFLDLTNRILKAFNEVNLTSGNFAAAVGFHAEAKDAINQAILDIYTFEDTEWPFAWDSTTFSTVIGTGKYNKDSDFTSVDWDSFRLNRDSATALTLTQTSGTATFTATTAHNFIVGDTVKIYGATQSGYNGDFVIISVLGNAFTFSVASTTVSPATGTIVAKSIVVPQKTLRFKDLESYRRQLYSDQDANRNSDGYGSPDYAVRTQENNIILSPIPNRVYTVYYEGFSIPDVLSLSTDVSAIPVQFDQVIVDKALHYCYLFRDNIEEAQLAHARYEDNVNRMRRILIPQYQYMTFTF